MNNEFYTLKAGDWIDVKVLVQRTIEDRLVVSPGLSSMYLMVIRKENFVKKYPPLITVGSQWKDDEDGKIWELIAQHGEELYLFQIGKEETTIILTLSDVDEMERIK